MPPTDDEVSQALRPVTIELSLAEAGVEPQRTWVADGSQERAADDARWVREHAVLLRP